MKRKYATNDRVKRSVLQGLRNDFETLEMKSCETVDAYFSRVMTVANKKHTCGEEMTDIIIIEKILRSLTKIFNYIVCFVEESNDIDEIPIDELQSSLVIHEQKIHRQHREEQGLKLSLEERNGG